MAMVVEISFLELSVDVGSHLVIRSLWSLHTIYSIYSIVKSEIRPWQLLAFEIIGRSPAMGSAYPTRLTRRYTAESLIRQVQDY